MKLSWKIFFSTLIITILTFSIGGYFLVTTIFRSAYNRECNAALEENKMLRSYFSTLLLTASSKSQSEETMSSISESIIAHFANDKLAIRILNEEQDVIAQSNNADFDENLLGQLKDNTLAYGTIKYESSYYIRTASLFQVFEGKVYLETIHDISSIFSDRQNLFSFYRKLIACMLAVNGFFVFLMALWTVSPLKKLSITTKEIARGKYNDRVTVKGRNEVGLLAEDFNKMADSLEMKIRDLEAKAISQRDFIGSFAHEIKTPLTSVIGYADMLRLKKMSEENRILAANYIFSEGKRMENLAVKLLDLLVVKNRVFEMRQISMKNLFDDIEGIMAPVLMNCNIIVQITVEDIKIEVEPDLMKTLIINLIDNARKAISEHGTIKLTGKQIAVDKFMITIEDNGKGIPDEELSRITEIFYTVDKSRFRGKGIGIGLALCKEIVEIHHGEMKFESHVNTGTCVSLIFSGGIGLYENDN